MSQIEPFFREAGAGAGVVCLHANASSSAQWRDLLERLAPQFHALAPDSYGAGRSPDWPSDRLIELRDEVALIEPVLERAGSPVTLVGHSYGAAIALIAALSRPDRVRAIALYEPTLFSLLGVDAREGDGIRDAVAAASKALDAGDNDAAARCFIDYWMGAGAWDATPEKRKPAIAASMRNVRRWGHALTTEPTTLAAFGALDVPVLYMVGKQSPRSARAVATRLVDTLPRVELVEFDDLGHMGPTTHPEVVNEAIAQFLGRVGVDADHDPADARCGSPALIEAIIDRAAVRPS